jgi:sedoheptulokinase
VGELGIDPDLLPEVSEAQGTGRLSPAGARALDLPEDIPVAPAIGDNQASILAGLDDPASQAFVTLGTGGQLSVVLAEPSPSLDTAPAGLEIRPFFSGMRIAVCASLAGGSAWQWLARTAAGWVKQLGLEPPDEDGIYRKLNELGLAATDAVDVRPTFHAQRWARQELGRIENLGPSPMDLGRLARGLAEGIFRELRSRMPESLLQGRNRLRATGNALRRNPLLRRAARNVLSASLELSRYSEEAAVGAARFAASLSD